ncbi:hypothetical protein ACFYYR_22160 [Streptomyces sp. NPDC001922]|uniref:hypothetical protein n=1 Tax=Streptomyces sp. NPDC001922 TaxID=3364624 RepID=UPI0036C7FCE6
MIRHTPALAAGLTPDDEVLLDAPDERLAPAVADAARGDHRAAAALLAATREAGEWESRDRYAGRLAVFAQSRSDWLTGWLAGAPRDPDALLLRAELAVREAWRRPCRAAELRQAAPLIDAAAEAGPRDPVPWRIALDHARGTDAARADFEVLWKEAVSRSPHHYGCHVAALQWSGSSAAGFAFAERAAEQALPGSLLHALPLRAAFPVLAGEGAAPGGRIETTAAGGCPDSGGGGEAWLRSAWFRSATAARPEPGPADARWTDAGGGLPGREVPERGVPGPGIPGRGVPGHVAPGSWNDGDGDGDGGGGGGGPMGGSPGAGDVAGPGGTAGPGDVAGPGGTGGPGDADGPGGTDGPGDAQWDSASTDDWIDAATDRAIGLSARYASGDPWPAEVRNLLAYALVARGRWAEALEEFRRIGPFATAFPWSHVSNDPLGQFLDLRDGVRIQLATTLPLRRRPGSADGPGH